MDAGKRQTPVRASSERGLASLLHRTIHPILQRRLHGALTVLTYHRVVDLAAAAGTFRPNISATPAGFGAQLDFLSPRYDIIAAGDLVAWLEGRGTLPPRPLLITFDDGYRDNYENAFPLLRERNLPAAIFLATDYIGSEKPFLSDRAAWLFSRTRRREGRLPLVGHRRWDTEARLQSVLKRWLKGLKPLPDAERRGAVDDLAEALEVNATPDQLTGLQLNWNEVREMAGQGITMGGHTCTHPILTRVTPEQADAEIRASKERIERETGLPVRTFAYPNGMPDDFDETTEELLRRHGFAASFTLLPGPESCSEARRRPLAIRRIFVSHKDDSIRFALKLLGLPRLRHGSDRAA